jgi:hypothetical protein
MSGRTDEILAEAAVRFVLSSYRKLQQRGLGDFSALRMNAAAWGT